MKLTGETKLFWGIIITSIVLLVVGGFIVLRPTKAFTQSQLIPKDTATRGSTDAVVYLVEFSDFQCPACKTFAPIVEQILQKHGSKILFAYRHFPLPQHPYAIYAAHAFEAANEQGKGWEMSDYLFENQVGLTETVINDGAKVLGLDIKQFEEAVSTKKYKQKIDQDLVDGKLLGVNSTPTFFLNGKKLNLFSADDLQKAVDEAVLKTE